MHPPKKITIVAAVCLIALLSVVYIQRKPAHSGDSSTKLVNLTIEPSKQSSATLEAIQEKVAPLQENSITDNVSADFAHKYADLKQKGKWNTDSQAALINSLTQNYSTSTTHGLEISDISTFSDLDVQKTHLFGNAVAKAVTNYYKTLKNSPLDTLSAVANNKIASTSVNTTLSPISTAYRSLAVDLQKIPAPAKLAATYLDVINGYVALADNIDDMKHYYDDPVRGLRGVSNYQKNFLSQAELLKTIASYFKTNGILFSNTDTGQIWNSL